MKKHFNVSMLVSWKDVISAVTRHEIEASCEWEAAFLAEREMVEEAGCDEVEILLVAKSEGGVIFV